MLRFLLFFALLWVAGCAVIPDGAPPKGRIVETPTTGAMAFADAANYLYTALAAYVSAERPELRIMLNADDTTRPYLDTILNRLQRRSALQIAADAPTVLHSYLKDNVWFLELFDREHNLIIWQQRVVIQSALIEDVPSVAGLH